MKKAKLTILYRTSSWSSDLLKSSKLIGRSGQTLREQLHQAMLEQKAGITPTNTDVPLLIEKDVETLPPMPEFVFEPKETKKEEPAVGSALKQTADGGSLNLVKRKRKKKKSTIPEIARKRYKQRKGMDSDSSFDSSDSAYDDDEEEEEAPRKTSPEPEKEEKEKGPTHLEQVVEATKNIVAPVPKRAEEEFDDIKVQLLKSHREGDLSNEVVKVNLKFTKEKIVSTHSLTNTRLYI